MKHEASRPPLSKPPGSVAAYWLQTGLWTLLILLVFELFVRVLIVKYPREEFLSGWGLVPVENSYQVEGTEGFAVTHFSRYGEARSLSTGGASVVVLGDSFTRGAQVDESKKYVTLTESLLLERGLEVDLHNLGLPERNMADVLYQAPAINAAYAPQIVIIQANRQTFKDAFELANVNYCIYRDGGIKLVHREDPPDIRRQNTISSSGLLSFIAYRMKVITIGEGQKPQAEIPAAPAAAEAGTSTSADASPDRAAEVDVRFEALVTTVKEAYPNSRIVFLVIPFVPIVPNDPSMEISWVNPDDEDLVRALEQIDGVFVAYPRDAFRMNYEQYHLLPRGFFNSVPNAGHLNESGHAMVASVLADLLEGLLR